MLIKMTRKQTLANEHSVKKWAEDLTGLFTQEDTQMAMSIWGCSVSCAIRELQIKTTKEENK